MCPSPERPVILKIQSQKKLRIYLQNQRSRTSEHSWRLRGRRRLFLRREDNFLEESLSVVTLGTVGILESEPMLSFSLSPEENEDKASGERFLKAEEAETLLKEHLAMRRV